MDINTLRKLNPDMDIFDVDSEEFKTFGRRVNLDTDEIVKVGLSIDFPEAGSKYEASTPKFEELEIAKEIKDKYFGTMPTEIGYCYGYNNKLNAFEWHYSSEINIAVTDLVLILAHTYDIKDNKIDTKCAKAFLLHKGDAVEVYATSLHFCPCNVEDGGFGCVVGLPAETNLPLDYDTDDKLLFRKNKWLLAHVENEGLIARGAVAGVTGKNYELTVK